MYGWMDSTLRVEIKHFFLSLPGLGLTEEFYDTNQDDFVLLISLNYNNKYKQKKENNVLEPRIAEHYRTVFKFCNKRDLIQFFGIPLVK